MTAGPRAVPSFGGCRACVLVVAAVLPVICSGCSRAGSSTACPPARRRRSAAWRPDFSLVDLDGNPMRLADLRGRPVIVNFWAAWCGPCVEEFPLLREAAEEHADGGLVVVGIV